MKRARRQRRRIKAIIKRLIPCFVLAFIFFGACPCFSWSGKCVGIANSDTIKIMHLGKAERICLFGIDCPERGQDFGTRARKFTWDMVFGKVVNVEPVDRDRYGRTALSLFQEEQILYL